MVGREFDKCWLNQPEGLAGDDDWTMPRPSLTLVGTSLHPGRPFSDAFNRSPGDDVAICQANRLVLGRAEQALGEARGLRPAPSVVVRGFVGAGPGALPMAEFVK